MFHYNDIFRRRKGIKEKKELQIARDINDVTFVLYLHTKK